MPAARSYDKPGEFQFDLPGVVDAPVSTSLALHFYAHHWDTASQPVPMDVTVNGKPAGHIAIADPNGLTQTLQISSDILTTASNHIAMTPRPTTATQTLPDLCFDRMEINYPRSYALTTSTLEFFPPSDSGGVVTLDLGGTSATTALVADVSNPVPIIYNANGGAANGKLTVATQGPASRRYLAVTPAGVRHIPITKVEPEQSLRSADNKGDLVVIAWPEFIDGIKPWAAMKTAEGHIVRIVDVNDIYDQFGYGHQSPHAIRAFLRHANLHWQGTAAGPAASAVLLVGDSTSAYRNEFHNDVVNYVPTMRMNMDGDSFASDQWYVTLFGDDAFADGIIGRFSVNSVEDLRNVVSKQLLYHAAPDPGPWQNTLGFIADHSEFQKAVDRVMEHVVPPRFFLRRIIMSDLPWIDNYYFPRDIADAQQAKVSPEATAQIRDLFNNGAAVVTYFGHGSPNIWSTQRMWFGGDSPNSDNLMLTNKSRLSIVINMTCNSGAIDYPQPKWNVCISEDFMRVANGGAVACFVPSGPGLTVQHERMMMEIGPILFGAKQEPIGAATQLAMWRYLAGGNQEELARMYILLGDPLLIPQIARPVSTPASGATPPVAQWPGTVVLPTDVAAGKVGGNFQFNDYNDHIEPGPIKGFTSSTVALTLPPADDKSARALAVFVKQAQGQTSDTSSTFMPVSTLNAMELTQWKRVEDADIADSRATLEFRVRNTTPLPLRNIQLQLFDAADGSRLAESSNVDVKPFADMTMRVEVRTRPGLMALHAAFAGGTEKVTLQTEPPITIAGLRQDVPEQTIPPAIIDPRSIKTVYRITSSGMSATVTGQVYILSREPLSNLRIGLENPAGTVEPDSIISVPPVGPGEGTRISMSINLPVDAPSKEYTVRFDPSGLYPEFTRFPGTKVSLGHDSLADIAITSVRPSNPSPTDGETEFFDVTVANLGDAVANGIRVEGFHITDNSQREKLNSQVADSHPLLNLDPHSSQTIRMRWDPFRNAGANQLIFAANSVYDIPDRAIENNAKTVGLNVRTKPMLYSVKAGVLPLRREDVQQRQIRFLARVRNYGQTGAHNLRVEFYATKEMKPEDYMGEEDIESIAAGETKDVVLTYKLKPHEENRKFNITFEVLYQGSRQRVPLR